MKKGMCVNDTVHVIAGVFILVSALLGYFVNKNWLFFTMFVGFNLFQFGFTKFCPLALILKKCGLKE